MTKRPRCRAFRRTGRKKAREPQQNTAVETFLREAIAEKSALKGEKQLRFWP